METVKMCIRDRSTIRELLGWNIDGLKKKMADPSIEEEKRNELAKTLDEQERKRNQDFIQIYETDERLHRVIDMALKLEGMPRNTSMHAAGVVICRKPIADNVPLSRNGCLLYTSVSDVGADNTVLSQGRGALPAVAAWAEGLRGAFRTEESVRAYVNFLQGKYKYLLGTQRDVYRFQARGAEVTAKPLTAFCDLWQYIAVCTADPERYAAAAKFVSLLLSDTVQGMLPRIGMLPVGGEAYGADNAAMYAAQKEVPEKTVSAFLTGKTVGELRAAGEAAINGDEIGAKNLEKMCIRDRHEGAHHRARREKYPCVGKRDGRRAHYR